MSAVPSGSKGRDVSTQFYHLHRVRTGWVEYFTTGRRPSLPRYDKTRRPTKAQLRKALTASGQILLALKQSGERLPDRVALNGVWGRWIDGR